MLLQQLVPGVYASVLRSLPFTAFPRLGEDHRAVLAPQRRGARHCPPREEEPPQLTLDARQEQDVQYDEAESYVAVEDRDASV